MPEPAAINMTLRDWPMLADDAGHASIAAPR